MNIKHFPLFIGFFFLANSIVASNNLTSEKSEQDSVLKTSKLILKSDQFNKGSFITLEDLLYGKFSGLLITPKNGEPGQQTKMSIRGENSIVTSDFPDRIVTPLMVIDGMPLYYTDQDGYNNVLSLINPDDIESIEVLKDLSAAALYGGAASNGAILIKTKTGSWKKGELRLRFSSMVSIGKRSNKVDMLSADELREVVKERKPNNLAWLGEANTDAQDAVDQTAYGTNQHLNVSGNIENTAYSASIGYTKRDGVFKSTDFRRNTYNFNIKKRLFDEHLELGLNLGGAKSKNNIEPPRAFEETLLFNPTFPLYNEDGSYFTETIGFDFNPLAKFRQVKNRSEIEDFHVDLYANYRLHFLPDLGFLARYKSHEIKGEKFYDYTNYVARYKSGFYELSNKEKKYNNLKLGLNYTYEFLNSGLSANLYYDFSELGDDFDYHKEAFESGYSIAWGSINSEQEAMSVALNYHYQQRLFLDFAYRKERQKFDYFEADWTSSQNLSVAYVLGVDRLEWISALKFRASLGKADYYRRFAWDDFVDNVKSVSFGTDFSLLSNKLQGAVTYFRRDTDKDNEALGLQGQYSVHHRMDVENKGLEVDLRSTLIKNDDVYWRLGVNLTKCSNELTKFYEDRDMLYIANYKAIKVGGDIRTFYLREHLYDSSGKLIEDLHNKDKVFKGSSIPNVFWGLSSNLRYKDWEFAFTLRGNCGKYSYNEFDSKWGNFLRGGQYGISSDYLKTNFSYGQISTYYLRESSFTHLENISLTYHVDRLFSKDISAKFFLVGQNLKTWTSYKGLNPDTFDGIDYDNYPRPKTYTIGMELSF